MNKQFIISLLLFSLNGFGQMPTDATEIIDISNIRASINTDGTLFNNIQSTSPSFEVPKDSGTHSIYSGSLWIGGKDLGGAIHTAAQTYNYSGKNDFWPGPISNAWDYTPGDSVWNHLWKISSQEISYHKWYWWQSGYVIPEVILNWPAHGDVNKGQAANLAPYIDQNNNGIYEPLLGDYPKIKGDEAVYFIFNDDREVHTSSAGYKLGVEVHGMAYGFNCQNSDALYNTLFIDYTFHNRSQYDVVDVFIGFFMDMDIGSADDDFSASDVTRSSYYIYNGDSISNPGTGWGGGLNYTGVPPAQSCTFLKGPLQDADGIDNYEGINNDQSINGIGYDDGIIDNERRGMDRFMSFNRQGPACCTDPESASYYYQYLAGSWKDGSGMGFGGSGHPGGGGTIPAKYMYPGTTDPIDFGTNGIDPNYLDTRGWCEEAEDNTPADRRGIGSTGPFTFEAGEKQEITMAFTFAKSDTGDNYSSVALMQQYIDEVRGMFLADTTPCGYGVFSGVEDEMLKKVEHDITVYPNPASDIITIQHSFDNPTYELYDVYGKLIRSGELNQNSIAIASLSRGLYFLKMENQTVRFVKQ